MKQDGLLRMSDIFSMENIRLAMADLSDKKDTVGLDGMHLSDLADFLYLNPHWCKNDSEQFFYRCGKVREYFVLTKKRKKRAIYQFNALDRLVARAASQVFEELLDPYLSDNCFSYREGVGILDALARMRTFIEDGYETMLEFDVEDFFETISHGRLLRDLASLVDEEVLALVKSFLKVTVVPDEDKLSYVKRKGLITGSSLSPVLSNFFLRLFDQELDDQKIKYVRYGDDYFLFFKDELEPLKIWKVLEERLWEFGLEVNKGKSGVFSPFRRKILGYFFTKTKNGVIIDKPPSKEIIFDAWKTEKLTALDPKFDIIIDGILTQQHWNLLFDSERGKVHLPINVSDYLNIYSDVTIDSRVVELLSERGIHINIMNKFGEKLATIEPVGQRFEMSAVERQLMAYHNEDLRFKIAREMERSILHNLRSVLRYYDNKVKERQLQQAIELLSEAIASLSSAKTINDLLMIEARARQDYFSAFQYILLEKDFAFTRRSRRPPEDALNALISFGNVFLYNYVSAIIYRSPLDIRFSFLHSASRRAESLQLDIADIFKPILVDRTIFALINRQELRVEEHFERVMVGQKEGVYLNSLGKRIFLRALKEKLRTVVTVKGRKLRYSDVIRAEVYKLHRFLRDGESYKAYRYTS